MKAENGYIKQIATMAKNANAWRKLNPDKEILVQFNFPRKVQVIGAISDAIEQKYVTTNEAGLELIKSMWPQNRADEPTIMMVLIALEYGGFLQK